ncbi:unannotated protein [freshwater metagenome]|uniref:Unannotated protein n=1 Tax=freshwater metagenome TaxID=449393 RepID=A0A6J7I8X2_9ZZZZ
MLRRRRHQCLRHHFHLLHCLQHLESSILLRHHFLVVVVAKLVPQKRHRRRHRLNHHFRHHKCLSDIQNFHRHRHLPKSIPCRECCLDIHRHHDPRQPPQHFLYQHNNHQENQHHRHLHLFHRMVQAHKAHRHYLIEAIQLMLLSAYPELLQ